MKHKPRTVLPRCPHHGHYPVVAKSLTRLADISQIVRYWHYCPHGDCLTGELYPQPTTAESAQVWQDLIDETQVKSEIDQKLCATCNGSGEGTHAGKCATCDGSGKI